MCSLVHNAVRRQLLQSMSIQCVLQTFKRLQICNALQLNTSRLRQCSLKAEQQTYLTAIHGSSGCLQTRYFSVNARANSKDNGGKKENGPVSLSRSRSDTLGHSAAQKVKAAGRDFTYLIVVIVGVGVTGGLLYVIFKELFSSSSPSKIYGKALEKCRGNPEVIGAFGEPIKGYGETTRRGRRQQVRHVEYIKDGLKHMRLKFYIEGAEPQMKGTVHTEMKEDPETGKYEFRYIFVDVEAYPRRTIVVEDNR